ncbi:MAG: hypothetical protein RI575_00285 [Balneolaceae bacterium]|nr:hypothetical protein [Balneolaceae bacterium]MDR9409085.1 hypothetical protein [Balneolaceae bacterium]
MKLNDRVSDEKEILTLEKIDKNTYQDASGNKYDVQKKTNES